MNIKKNDTVIVLSGKDKGVKGKVLVAMPSENKVIVEKVNVATCHTKPRRQGEEGGIVKRETPIRTCKEVRKGRSRRLQGRRRQEDPYLPQVRRRNLRKELKQWLTE